MFKFNLTRTCYKNYHKNKPQKLANSAHCNHKDSILEKTSTTSANINNLLETSLDLLFILAVERIETFLEFNCRLVLSTTTTKSRKFLAL